ncbi:MAG: hypothetical protein AB8E15_01990 [Bdellovibrionales bacterium]
MSFWAPFGLAQNKYNGEGSIDQLSQKMGPLQTQISLNASSEELLSKVEVLDKLTEAKTDYKWTFGLDGKPQLESSKLPGFSMQRWSFQTQEAVFDAIRKLNRTEYGGIPSKERNHVLGVRTISFLAVSKFSIGIWYSRGMDMDSTHMAISLSLLTNAFFIFYENVADKKIYTIQKAQDLMLKGVSQANKFHEVLERLKIHLWSRQRLESYTDENIKFLGRAAMMTIVNMPLILAYEVIKLNSSLAYSGNLVLNVGELLVLTLFTGTRYSITRGNLKLYGSDYFSPKLVQYFSSGSKVVLSMMYVLVLSKTISPETAFLAIGIPGWFFARSTNEKNIHRTAEFYKEFRMWLALYSAPTRYGFRDFIFATSLTLNELSTQLELRHSEIRRQWMEANSSSLHHRPKSQIRSCRYFY